jgi:CBS domain containing-hemolysin-like protein
VGACEHDKQPALKQLLRPPTFVPETKKIAELLAQFQKGKVHMAIVLDEYGGVAGLVTIEDVVEEIVGEIEDEFDIDGRQLIKPSGDGGAEVSARAKVKEVNEALGINLPESEDYDTISGLISSRLDRIPGAGESLDVDNVRITILEADPRRVKRVAIKVKKEES